MGQVSVVVALLGIATVCQLKLKLVEAHFFFAIRGGQFVYGGEQVVDVVECGALIGGLCE
jgi:hypothetical protein